MPIAKYACSICGVVFDAEEGATSCETKGQPDLIPVGTIFLHDQKHYMVTSASYVGHEAKYWYKSNEIVIQGGLTLPPNPIQPQMLDFWQLLHKIWRELSTFSPPPKIYLGKDSIVNLMEIWNLRRKTNG